MCDLRFTIDQGMAARSSSHHACAVEAANIKPITEFMAPLWEPMRAKRSALIAKGFGTSTVLFVHDLDSMCVSAPMREVFAASSRS
jgi:hypothetical protein